MLSDPQPGQPVIVQTPVGAYRGTVESICAGRVAVIYVLHRWPVMTVVGSNWLWALDDPTAPESI